MDILTRPTYGAFRADDTLAVIALVGGILAVPRPYHYVEGPLHLEPGKFFINEYIQFLGRKNFEEYTEKWNLPLTEYLKKELESSPVKSVLKTSKESLINPCNAGILDDTAFSFLDRLLSFSFVERVKFIMFEALEHPFLADISSH